MIRAILTSDSMRSLRHKPDRSCATKPGHISCHRQRRSLSAVQRSWPGLFYPRTHTDEPSIWELFAYMTRQTVAARVPEGHVVNSQEREIISGIFKRLEQAANQPRDPETERFIADKIRQQPYASYAMAQLIYVQEEAIKSLNQQVEELRAEVERTRSQPQSGGLLSSMFGDGSP